MRLCPGPGCHWYSHEKRDKLGQIVQRKCYYEPGCWRGILDILIFLVKLKCRRIA